MSKFQYTSVDRIISKLRRDLDIDSTINEGDIVEWIGEALQAVGAVTQYEEAVSFIEVDNHHAEIPAGLYRIIQIAKNTCWTNQHKEITGLCPQDAIKNLTTTNPIAPAAPAIPVPLDAYGEPITDYDLAYYRPYFDLKWEYQGWGDSMVYRNCFSPIRLKSSSFFESIVCREDDSKGLYAASEYEYNIVNKGQTIRFSFDKGQVAIAYIRMVVDDETGYPLVPDEISYQQAMVAYINFILQKKDFYKGREGSQSRYLKAESDWHWYCKQAGNLALMPTLDELENIMQGRNYLIPRTNEYYSFFGRLNKAEVRKFDNQDNRNRPKLFRGYNTYNGR